MITCTFENGHTGSKRHVTVDCLILNDKQEILLTKRGAKLSRPGKYTVPGGFLDRDESVSEGALRELTEETGLKGKVISLFQITDNPNRPKEDRQNVNFTYLVEITGGEERMSDEVVTIEWISEENLPAEEEFAFDHRHIIQKYFSYLREQFSLPIVESK